MAKGKRVRRIKHVPGQEAIHGFSGIDVNSTEQEIKIGQGLARHGRKIKACVEADIPESTARKNSAEICSRPGVVAALTKALKRADVGIDDIARTIRDGYQAQKQIVVKGRVKEYPDHGERRQTARFHAELENLIPDKKMKLEHSGEIAITDEADKELVNWLQSAMKK